jgi:hypothetical protein
MINLSIQNDYVPFEQAKFASHAVLTKPSLLLMLYSNFSFLSLFNTRKEVSVCTRNTEQCIHILERQPFGFWNKEVDKRYGQCQACGEHEVCAISDICEHIRYAPSDNEVHQPVSCCADCYAETTNTETVTVLVSPQNIGSGCGDVFTGRFRCSRSMESLPKRDKRQLHRRRP